MSQHPDEESPSGRPVWQRPDWRVLERPLSPEDREEAGERALQAHVHEVRKVASTLEEAKQSGRDVLLRCISPQKVPTVLDCFGAEFLREQRGDYSITGEVAFQEGCWTYTAVLGYEWDKGEQMWKFGQDLVYEVIEESEINLWEFADLLMENGWVLEG